jgi:hypothetical protein
VVVTDHQAIAIALWAAHTHAIDAFEATSVSASHECHEARR